MMIVSNLSEATKAESLPGSGAGMGREWFGVQSQPNKLAIAEQSLRQLPGVECFLPRLKYRRNHRRKQIWVTGPLFPGYLFARFNFQQSLRAVYYAQGVSRVIHFGDHWPIIPADIVEQLKLAVGETGIKIIENAIECGDEVQISRGPFQNFSGLVNRVYPERMRITVLLDFLGSQTAVEVSVTDVTTPRNFREGAWPG